jgi:hypothetical protein
MMLRHYDWQHSERTQHFKKAKRCRTSEGIRLRRSLLVLEIWDIRAFYQAASRDLTNVFDISYFKRYPI